MSSSVSVTDKFSGKASINCKGTDLFDFLTSEQITSVVAGFPKGNKCGMEIDVNDPGKNSSLSIKLNNKPEQLRQ